MINPIDILEEFPVRRTKDQKTSFIEAVTVYATKQGYPVSIEEGKRGLRNIVIGDPSSAKYLVTAHYDTPASIGLPNLIAPNNPIAFFGLQFMLVAILLLAAFAVGFVTYWTTANEDVAFLAGYAVYMVILFLMLFGPANPNNANDNTSGVVTVLEILTSLPETARNHACFVLFDLEEAGLVGSAAYRKQHKQITENQIVLNLDCVGDGDVIQMTPVKKAREDESLLNSLSSVCGRFGNKQLTLRSKGFYHGSSDHKNFPKGVAIMALQYKKGIGLYCGKIHTKRDTVLDRTNINVLRAALVSVITHNYK